MDTGTAMIRAMAEVASVPRISGSAELLVGQVGEAVGLHRRAELGAEVPDPAGDEVQPAVLDRRDGLDDQRDQHGQEHERRHQRAAEAEHPDRAAGPQPRGEPGPGAAGPAEERGARPSAGPRNGDCHVISR
jgi:hypothetical protein